MKDYPSIPSAGYLLTHAAGYLGRTFVAFDKLDQVVLIDMNIPRRGFVSAEQFVERFGHLGIPRVVHRGELTADFVRDVRAGKYGTGEGVICKGGEGHDRWMAKVKTTAYLH